MALFEVTDPQTGITLELEGDSAPTEAELIEIFNTVGGQDVPVSVRGDAADNVRGELALGVGTPEPIDFSQVQATTREIPREFPDTPEGERQRLAAGTGIGETILVGAGQALRSFGRGVEQLAGGPSQSLFEQAQEARRTDTTFQAEREKEAQRETGRLADIKRREQEDVAATAALKTESPIAFGTGEALPSIVAGGGLAGGTFKAAVGIGGLEGALKFADEPKNRVINTALGAGFGAAGEGVTRLIKRVFSPKLFDRETGQLTEGGEKILVKNFGSVEAAAEKMAPLKDRLAQLAETGQITKTDIIEIGKQLGVPVMTSDLFPPESIISGGFRSLSEKIPVFGTGGKRGAQQKARAAAANKFLDKFGVDVDSRTVTDSLIKSVEKRKNAAGERINQFKGQMNELGEFTPNIVIGEIDKQIQRIATLGRVDTPQIKKALQDLQGLKENLTSTGGNFETLRNDRTLWREITEQAETSGRSQFTGQVKSSLDSVYNAFTRQLDDVVGKTTDERQLLRYKAADKIYRQEALKMTKTKIKNVLDKGEITPEGVEALFSATAKKSDIKRLFQSLSAEGRAATRAGIISNALRKSTVDGVVNPSGFASQLEKLDRPIKEFFRGRERKQILGLKKLLNATKRAQDAGVVTPTGQVQQVATQTAVTIAAGSGIPGFMPLFVSQAGVGALGRAYESPPVRNMLIRLANAKSGSAAERALLDELGQSLASELAGRGARAAALGADETIGGQ